VLGSTRRFEESLVLRVAGSGLFSVAEGSRRPLVRSGLSLPASRSWELGWVRPPIEVDPESVLPGMSLKSSKDLRVRVGMHESYPDDEPLLGEGLERPDLSETRAYITALWSW
jgi:hypothetical protein